MEKKIRILCILASLDVCNGIVSYAMNYYRYIDKNKIQMDFLVSDDNESVYWKEIKENGDNIYIMPELKYRNTIKFCKKVDEFFKYSNYDIVHCHLANAGMFYLKAAKKYGVKSRILHSHATKSAESILKKIRNGLMIPFTKLYANEYFACSKAAGEYLFKNKKYNVINNAILPKKYLFNNNIRVQKRKELELDDKIIIGNIGRFSMQKNHLFLIDIFYELKKLDSNVVLILVGEGPLEGLIRKKVSEYGLEKDIVFTGKRLDTNDLYQAMDVFLLPSLYEGLPLVGIEAQCSDLPLIVSNTITKELSIIESTQYLSLDKSAAFWAEVIIKCLKKSRKDNKDIVRKMNYDIESEAKKLENIYIDILNKHGR